MPGKDILIFSDGTGQFGGLRPDQRLSNVYKLYRAMRPGPDSAIRPSEQVAFYDPGLGASDGRGRIVRRIQLLLSSAFGTGISENIVECYEAILKAYEPGDRIFLFGFSRGAYTARCVANTLNLCGVPSSLPSGAPIPRHGVALRRIAEEAVYTVYEHGSGKERAVYEAEREEQARRFRKRYSCEGRGLDGESQGNVAPTFIGVFDTVAALGSVIVRRLLAVILLLSLATAAATWWHGWPMLGALALIPTLVLFIAFLGIVKRQLKVIRRGPSGKRFSWHFAAWNLKYYDRFLDTNVGMARHALSIDENRARFPVVGWGNPKDVARMESRSPKWLDQQWFAGNHSDVGGSYPEDESRLSDITLAWMIGQLQELDKPPLMNHSLIQVSPSSRGLQHDEVKASREQWLPRWWPDSLRFGWKAAIRSIRTDAPLHPSVVERINAGPVPQYDIVAPYCPAALSNHMIFASVELNDEAAE